MLANISLAFSLDAQTRFPPPESCAGSATDPAETVLRGIETVETVGVDDDTSEVSGGDIERLAELSTRATSSPKINIL